MGFYRPIEFKDNLRTIEPRFPKNLRTNEARSDFTGPYKTKPVKKDRFRWNLSIFHWCVDTNQRGYKSVRIHKATPIHARMYLAEKAKIFFPGGDTHMDKKN